MADLVDYPATQHRCHVGTETRELPADHESRRYGFTQYVVFVHGHDPVGTVRACPDCGRTWVAHRPDPGTVVNSWRPEGRIERWRRERRRRD